MRVVAIVGLGLYGAANVLVGVFDLTVEHRLPRHVDVLLVLTGVALIVGAAIVARRSHQGWTAALTSLVLASLLALYNERVLGLGHPSHHLIRGAYTLLVLYAAWRCTRATGDAERAA